MGNMRVQWVASTLHTTSEHGVSSITTADGAHLGWQQSTELTPRPQDRFKWTRSVSRERRNLVSAHVTSRLNWPLQNLLSPLSLCDCPEHRVREEFSSTLCSEQSHKESGDIRCCPDTIVLPKMSTVVLETCRGMY